MNHHHPARIALSLLLSAFHCWTREMRSAHLATAVLVALLSPGCAGFMAFPPNPEEYERWSKPGVDQITKWKAMLECNFASPFAVAEEFPGGQRTDEEVVLAMKCMEAQGFRHDYTFSPCGSEGRLRLSACSPITNARKHRAEIRLSSGYCNRYPRARACAP